ncbi:MAG: hypothetical protein L3J82_00845 [Planctomycetes bacterium]|nr:hypothetical protein [Planctomycetota bacterium]
MKCRGTIDDPFLHKKKSAPPKLAIPLHGKIISASGITNLSEIVAASEEYSDGFDPSTIMLPGQFDLSVQDVQERSLDQQVKGAGGQSMVIIVSLMFLAALAAGFGVYYWFVLRR